MVCCVSNSLELQLWKLLTLTTAPSKRTAVVCLVLIFFSVFFSCFWSRKLLLTFFCEVYFLRDVTLPECFFRIVLRIVPGIMGLYAVLCCNYTICLHCIVRLRFKMNILCNNVTSLDGMQALQVHNLVMSAAWGLRVVIIRMLHMKVVDVKSVAM